MAGERWRFEHQNRWSERTARIILAAIAAIAARSSHEQFDQKIIILVAFMAAGEVVAYILTQYAKQGRLRGLAARKNKQRGVRGLDSAVGRSKRKRRARPKPRANAKIPGAAHFAKWTL